MLPSRRIVTMGGDKFRDEHSIAFDGSNDYVLTDFKPDYIHTNATHAFWVKMNDFSSSQVMGIHGNKRWYFGFDTSNLFIGVANTHNGSSLITPSPALVAGQWFHYCVTAIDGTATIYINAVAQGTMSYTQSSSTNPSEGSLGYTIGVRNDSSGTTSYMACNISEVVDYNIGLTSSQVKTIYNGREPYNHKEGIASGNLKAWWRMGDGTSDGFSRTASSELSGNGLGVIRDMATASATNVVTGWTNVDFDTCTISGLDVSSAISDGSAAHEFSSNAINATAGDLLEISFTIAGSLIPSNDKLLCKLSPNSNLNSAVFDCKINAAGNYHFIAQFEATDSTSYVGFRAVSEAANFSMTNFKCRKFEDNVGAMINMAANDFKGDTP